jgi:F-type H+-transporting ATPase subunit gamma
MGAVIANIARRHRRTVRRADDRHRQGPGSSAGGLHRRARPVRRFNSQIVRLARDHAPQAAEPKARRSRSSASARRATISASRIRLADHRARRTASKCAARLRKCRQIAKKVIETVRSRRVRRLHAVLFAFKSVIAQIPTAQQIIPGFGGRGAYRCRPNAVYEYEPMPGEILDDLLPRNISVQIFRALLENNASKWAPR